MQTHGGPFGDRHERHPAGRASPRRRQGDVGARKLNLEPQRPTPLAGNGGRDRKGRSSAGIELHRRLRSDSMAVTVVRAP
jgi:hypothetical protein